MLVNTCQCLSMIHQAKKGQVQCEYMLVNINQWFTWPQRPSTMWIFPCQCLSMIHLAKKAKCNVNLCLSIFINDSPGQKSQVQCESMLVNVYQWFTGPKRPSAMWIYVCQYLSMIHQAKKAKCNVNLCLSMFINDLPGQKGQVQCVSMLVIDTHPAWIPGGWPKGWEKLPTLLLHVNFMHSTFCISGHLKLSLSISVLKFPYIQAPKPNHISHSMLKLSFL